jgi:type 1 glutamine amidotransferase
MSRKRFLIAGFLAILAGGLALMLWAGDEDKHDQSRVPIEVQPTDPSLAKIVLVAGHPSHGPGEHEFFAGCALLMKCLGENPGVFPVMAKMGWPTDPKTFEGAKAVVLYMDGGSGHPLIQDHHMQQLQPLIDAGAGFVNLHYAVEYPRDQGQQLLSWLGGYYETGFSVNPTWTAHFKALPEHPITRGVKPFSIKDEWYYNIRFIPEMRGVTPILTAVPPDNTRFTAGAKEHPGREEIMAWAFDRPGGGRSFGFTGAHFHRNWGDENFRRLVINAILWSAKQKIPEEGAKVDLAPGDLDKNLDRKRS